MSDECEAKAAIDSLNGSEFMGVKITVEASHSKVRPKPGMGGKGQCYRCGKSGHWSKECPRNSYDRYNHERYNLYHPSIIYILNVNKRLQNEYKINSGLNFFFLQSLFNLGKHMTSPFSIYLSLFLSLSLSFSFSYFSL